MHLLSFGGWLLRIIGIIIKHTGDKTEWELDRKAVVVSIVKSSVKMNILKLLVLLEAQTKTILLKEKVCVGPNHKPESGETTLL